VIINHIKPLTNASDTIVM